MAIIAVKTSAIACETIIPIYPNALYAITRTTLTFCIKFVTEAGITILKSCRYALPVSLSLLDSWIQFYFSF